MYDFNIGYFKVRNLGEISARFMDNNHLFTNTIQLAVVKKTTSFRKILRAIFKKGRRNVLGESQGYNNTILLYKLISCT